MPRSTSSSSMFVSIARMRHSCLRPVENVSPTVQFGTGGHEGRRIVRLAVAAYKQGFEHVRSNCAGQWRRSPWRAGITRNESRLRADRLELVEQVAAVFRGRS
jgi:hypothetical protein